VVSFHDVRLNSAPSDHGRYCRPESHSPSPRSGLHAQNGDCVVLRMIKFSTGLAAADLTGQAKHPPVLVQVLVTLNEDAFAKEEALHSDPFEMKGEMTEMYFGS
jgi:hypothetical protein